MQSWKKLLKNKVHIHNDVFQENFNNVIYKELKDFCKIGNFLVLWDVYLFVPSIL